MTANAKKKGIVIDAKQAFEEVIAATPVACQEINRFAHGVFLTRGGRMGSGMGVLLESLWGYYVDKGRPAREVGNEGWEIGWLSDNEYNDFACLQCGASWDPTTKEGELLRVEAKSVNSDAEEPKGHFDGLINDLGPLDLLLVLVWAWQPADRGRVYPSIQDHFIGAARPIADLRDQLHLARGGSFVTARSCPDGCLQAKCTHAGEPLNASGKRERITGPESRRPKTVSFAANFGGLLRMLKTASPHARSVFRKLRAKSDIVHRYISFVHRNFPREEENQYLISDWRNAANTLGIEPKGLARDELIASVREHRNYMDMLRKLD